MRAPTRAEPGPARLGAIRYMGNKVALLEAILPTLERLAPEGSLLVDPMAGSHAVTYAAKHRHRILASDAQAYSAALGRAWVDNVTVRRLDPAFVECLAEEAERIRTSDWVGFLEQEFSDTYLGTLQCRQLDALRMAVDRVAPDDEPRRWLAISALLTAACRGQASPGHFAQFLPPDHPRTLKLREVDLFATCFETLRSAEVREGASGNRSLGLPWRELVRAHARALRPARAWYLDPPYTRDQYSRFYHFLENVVRHDRPVLQHKARYRTDRFRSAFCSPRSATAELGELFDAIAHVSPDASVLVSYSSRGLMSKEDIIATARARFELADFSEHATTYSTQGKGKLGGVREWLFSFSRR